MKNFFVIILVFVFNTGFSQNPDIQLLKHINLSRNTFWDPSMKTLTNTTAGVCVAVPAALIGYSYFKKDSLNFRKSVIIGTSMATAAAITWGLKYTVNRTRPYVTYPELYHPYTEGSPSFPSSHTSISFSLATSLSLEYPKWYVIVPSYLWASSVAYSRMHLGVHYPSDVLAGALVGAGSAYLNYKLNQLLGNKKLVQKAYRLVF